MTFKSGLSLIALASLAMAASCSPAAKPVEAAPVAPATATAPVAAAPAVTLPVSLNAVMVSLVDHASEPLWVDAYKAPKNAAGWRETEYDAYQMAVSGKLIQLAGTGPSDADWVSQPEWKTDADEMSAAGMMALRAAQAKDVKSLGEAGDRLVAACEACHKKFKPGLTSMGLYKSPSYPPK
jgi:hypothetical protein